MIRFTCSILCYNYGRYLGQAIESCLNQIPGDFTTDVLVIDDGSTDETPEVCARYGSRIRVERSPNEGFPSSLTKAIALAEGDYVCLLDADDYFLPEKLVTLRAAMEGMPLLLIHPFVGINEKGERTRYYAGGATSSNCVRRDAASTLLPIRNEFHLLPLDQPGHSVRLETPLACHRVHPASMQGNPVAGAWQQELSAVHTALVSRLDTLIAAPPFWVSSVPRLKQLRAESAELAVFTALEAALQRGERLRALACSGRLILTVLRERTFRFFHLKMLIRAALGIPVYKLGKRGAG